MQGIPEPCPEERDMKRFDRQRLFEAAASGDVMLLEGLHQYLYQNQKKLSNTECEAELLRSPHQPTLVCPQGT